MDQSLIQKTNGLEQDKANEILTKLHSVYGLNRFEHFASPSDFKRKVPTFILPQMQLMLLENISFNPIRNTPLVVVVIYGREPALMSLAFLHRWVFAVVPLCSFIQSTNSIDVDIVEGAK